MRRTMDEMIAAADRLTGALLGQEGTRDEIRAALDTHGADCSEREAALMTARLSGRSGK